MTLKRKSNATTADPDSVKKPRLDTDGERPMTEKEKRKAARMVRNRTSAQLSRDKKREYLEGLEATIATLQAENKDLRDRMIGQNTNSIMTGGHYALPLSPDPSSIAIPAKRDLDATLRQFSFNGDDSEDEDEDDGESSMAFDRERSKSMISTRRPSAQASPQSIEPAPISAQHAQALVTLTTENASLKNRLAKLEKVVQVLLGMNGGIAPAATDSTANLDVLRLLGPDVPQAPVKLDNDFGTLDPSTYLPPQVSPSDICPGLPASQASSISQTLPTELLPTGPALTFPAISTPASLPSFPITENQDHARHPAAGVFLLPCANGQEGGSGTGNHYEGDEAEGREWFEEGAGMAHEVPYGGTTTSGMGGSDDVFGSYDHDFQRRLEDQPNSDLDLGFSLHNDSNLDFHFGGDTDTFTTTTTTNSGPTMEDTRILGLGLEGMDARASELDLSLFGFGVDEFGMTTISDPLGLLSSV